MISINPITSIHSSILGEKTQSTFPQTSLSHPHFKNDLKDLLSQSNKNKTKNLNKLMEASKAFEALLVKEVFKTMQKSHFKEELIKENSATKLFKDFLNTEHSQTISQTSNFGIAEMIFKQQSTYLNNVSHETLFQSI